MRVLCSVLVFGVSCGRAANGEQTPPPPPSFAVYSYRGGPPAVEVLIECQRLRKQIQEAWLGEGECEPWRPACEIVLHATRPSYWRAVGGAVSSNGSSLIRFSGAQVSRRRIDLLVRSNRELPALTHELTHVVLADQFGGDYPPMWADEGIATLADTEEKKRLHRKDCLAALRSGSGLRLVNLLQLQQFTSSHQVPAFYGQSLSLVQFLVARDSPSKLVPFLRLAQRQGYDFALRKIYAIDDVLDLEDLWREYVVSGDVGQGGLKSGPLLQESGIQ